MASIIFRYFALQIFVILLVLRSTAAYDVQGLKKIDVHGGSGFARLERNDHTKLENIDAVPTAPEVTNGKIGGRKMMRMMVKEGKARKVMKQGQAMTNGEASTISGARNCNDLKVIKELKINTKLSDRRSIRDDQVNMKMGKFMVFNSDYHVPKPHPPRNN